MILLVAAASEELGDLRGEVLGVGPVVAAATMARILGSSSPQGVVMIGTAGAYPGGPAVGTVIKARRVGLADGALADGFAAHQQAVADDVLAVSWLPAAPDGEGAARTTVQLGPHRADIGLIRHAQAD